jgi:hypothetical protein
VLLCIVDEFFLRELKNLFSVPSVSLLSNALVLYPSTNLSESTCELSHGKYSGDYTAAISDTATRPGCDLPGFSASSPLRHNHRTRHTRPDLICRIMGVQQRSGRIAHRLRLSCILPHFSAVTALAELHTLLPVNPLGSHQPADRALTTTNQKINNKKKEETPNLVQSSEAIRSCPSTIRHSGIQKIPLPY